MILSRKKQNKLLLFVIPLLTLLVGCLEDIELDPPNGTKLGIVVQGFLIKGQTQSTIDVDISNAYNFSVPSRLPVRARSVALLNSSNQKVEVPFFEEGKYRLVLDNNQADFVLNYETKYQLEVVTLDENRYLSEMKVIMPTPDSARLSFQSVDVEEVDAIGGYQKTTFFSFKISTSLTHPQLSKKARFLWQTENTFRLTDSPTAPDIKPKTCYITSNIDVPNVKVFDGNQLTSSKIDDYEIFQTTADFRFAEGYYLTIYQQSLSSEAYQYWSQIRNVTQRNGNQFEAPPGLVLSNFTNVEDKTDRISGFFYATEQDTLRLFISREMAGFRDTLCPIPSPYQPSVCLDCLSEPISTLERPTWWKE